MTSVSGGHTLSIFSRGADSLRIDLSMHSAHREALVNEMVRLPKMADAIVLAGGGEQSVYDSDTVWDFKQESNFQYLFGVKEPGCYGLITLNPVSSILFIPRLPKEYAQWLGQIKPQSWFKETYLVDAVHYVDEMSSVLADELQVSTLAYYDFTNLDSGISLPVPSFSGSEKFTFVRGDQFAHTLNELRVLKSGPEIAILQYTNDVSCRAHIDTMKEVYSKRHGAVTSMEHFAETNFRFQAGLGGCARVGYHCIACSGENNAILHYGHAAEQNNEEVPANSLRLLDMGAEYHCYTADVTCTFPTNGSFSAEQREVYESVWESVLAVEALIKPGVDYRDMHRLSQRVMMSELKKRTDMFPGNIDELVKHNVCAFFMPHGLGHMLGLAVHDVGGYLPGESKDAADLSLKGLRLGRALKAGMVLTVEPGFYFIDYLISELKAIPEISELVNFDAVYRFKKLVGGIRIEDNIVVTPSGCRVLTDVPRTVADIEAVMQGTANWGVGKHYREYSN